MSRTVGSMISVTMFLEKKLFEVLISWLWMVPRVSGPNSGAMKARLPSIPSRRGGRDSTDQNPAWADSEKIESSQLLEMVRLAIRNA